MDAEYTLKDEITEDAKDLIKNLLQRDVKKRFTVEKVLKHAWMQNIDLHIPIFNDGEKTVIKKEFVYCDDDASNLNTIAQNYSFNFTDRNLNST